MLKLFDTYYSEYVADHLRGEFPKQISCNRFVQLVPRILVGLCAYLRRCYGRCRGIRLIDSTALAVCHNRRISQQQVFDGIAQRGRTSVDWFFGFKLHLVVNDWGELLSCCVTAGNVDDRRPVPQLVRHLWGKLFGDKGYLSQPWVEQLMEDHALELITKVRSNMKPRLLNEFEQFLLRKRSIVETIYDQLKNISQIEHSRHRSLVGFMLTVIGGLIAYCHQPKKPSLNLEFVNALVSN